MSFEFKRGDVNTIMLSVLRLSGTVPTFPGDYITPKVRVSHINGGPEVEDLAATNMTQVPSSNRWYHKFTVPLSASFTKYLVTFETTIEGVTTQASEEFKVVPTDSASGTGEFAIELNLVNSITLQPIVGAIVNIREQSNPSVIIATSTTDSTGKATVFLNTGNYIVEFNKTGVISEVHTLTVDSMGGHELSGD